MFSLGRIVGVPVQVHWTLPALLVVLGILLPLGQAVALWGCLTLSAGIHELGHALVARRVGAGVVGVELRAFDGATRLVAEERPWRQSLAIAGAGPLASIALATFAVGAGWLWDVPVLFWLAVISAIVGAVNALPILPFDGGRVVLALCAARHPFPHCTRMAARVNLLVAAALALAALALLPTSSWGAAAAGGAAIACAAVGRMAVRRAEAIANAAPWAVFQRSNERCAPADLAVPRRALQTEG